MKTFRQFFFENKDTTLVFAYGRFNPPTVAHEMLVEKVVETANKNNASYLIVPSHSTKPPDKNPLNAQQKIEILKYMVPDSTRVSDVGTTFIQTLQKIQEMGYRDIIQVCGSDREPEFKKLVETYNGRPDKTGNIPFQFQSYNFASSGERDPDSEGMEGMSASKLRKLASEGDLEQFKLGMSLKVPDELKERTFEEIRKIATKQ
jgi:hypothetical protein